MSDGTPAPGPAPAEGPASKHPSDHVNLRVTYLIAGNPRPPHDLGLVPASTTVAELKTRLQQELLEHPQPHEQRLIYQGRPLMQSSATLREALRLEGPIGPLPYTMHIIISSRPASSQFRPSQPTQMAQQGTPQLGPPPVEPMDPQSTLEQAQRVQAMAQAQLNAMQQHMAMLNPALAQAMAHMQPNFNATIQIQSAQAQLPHHLHPRPASTNPLEPTGAPHGLAGLRGQDQLQAAFPNTQPQPNGTYTAIPTQHTTTLPDSQATPLPALPQGHGLEPMPRPSSAPGHPPARSNPPLQTPRHNHAPSMTRTSQVFGPIALPFPHPTHLPFPFSAHMQNPPASHTQPTVWLTSSRNGPEALLFAPGHGYYTSAPTAPSTASSAFPSATMTVPATASIVPPPVSDPASAPAAATNDTNHPDPAQAQPAEHPNPNAQGPLARRERNANLDNEDIFAFIIQRGWLFLRLYMFMFVLSEPGTWRRYLLLFLAVIVCILPRRNPINNAFAAARRHIDNLIGPPHPQPRDRNGLRGPREDGVEVARARVQAAADRAQHAQAEVQAGNAVQPAATAASPRPQPQGGVSTTPEETARRLLREHEQRNPIIQAVYRVEQAIALFLASLIPGVGERHVAAREEVRREEERARLEEQARQEAEEKKAREEVERRAEEAAGEASPSSEASGTAAGPSTAEKGKGKEAMVLTETDAQAGSSSAVEPNPETEDGMRARFT